MRRLSGTAISWSMAARFSSAISSEQSCERFLSVVWAGISSSPIFLQYLPFHAVFGSLAPRSVSLGTFMQTLEKKAVAGHGEVNQCVRVEIIRGDRRRVAPLRFRLCGPCLSTCYVL